MKKRIFCILVATVFLLNFSMINVSAEETFGYAIACSDAKKIGIENTTKNIGAIEIDTEKIVVDSNIQKQFEMTGLPVMLMNALVASQNVSGTTVNINSGCIVDSKNNVLGLKVGMNVNVNDLIAASVLYNDRNAAVSLALGVSGSKEAFVELMNRTARRYSMKKTVFKNCTGDYDKEQITNTENLLILMYSLYKGSSVIDITSSEIYYIRTPEINSKIKTLKNPFKMIDKNSANYKQSVYGFGSSSDSKGSAISMIVSESDGKRFLIAMKTDKASSALSDAESAVDYLENNFNLVDVTKIIQDIGNKVTLKIGGERVEMAVSKGKYKKISLVVNSFYSKSVQSIDEYKVENPKNLPSYVNVGDEIKGFTVKYKDTVVATVDMTVRSIGEQQTTKNENSFTIYSSDDSAKPGKSVAERLWIPTVAIVAVGATAILIFFGRKNKH